jgi:hypothetical protein
MRYALLLHHGEPAPGEIPEETIQQFQAAFDAYARSLEGAGVLRDADILAPSDMSTTVTVRGGELQVQDGPFAEAKEMLGGVFVIDVPDLDAAVAWAEQCPGAQYGVVEVRPVGTAFVDGEWRS